MTEVAALGLSVDSSQVTRATVDLAKLSGVSETVERATAAMAKRAGSSYDDMRQRVQQTGAATERFAVEMKRAMDAVSAGNDNAARSVYGNGDALRQLSFQLNDAATMALSGSGAFQILATQGGQIFQVAQQADGGFKGLASSIVGLVTPSRVAIGAVALIGTTAALAYSRWAESDRELRRSLVGTGRDAGLTVDRLNAAAEAAARLQRSSVGEARGTIAALARTGRVGGDMLAPIAGIQRDFAATLGLDVAEANKMLASSFADPVRGAEELNDKLGGLSRQARQYIELLVAGGQEQKAQQFLLDKITPRLGRATELTSFWAREWARVSGAAGDALDKIGAAIDRATSRPGQRSFLEDAEARLDALRAQSQGMVVDKVTGRVFGGLNPFGTTQEQLQTTLGLRDREILAVNRVTQELRLQEVAMHAIKVGQEAIVSGAERWAQVARGGRLVDEAVASARRQGQPEQRYQDDLTQLISDFEKQRAAREHLYSSANGSDAYFEARRRQEATARAIRERLQNDGRGLFGYGLDANLAFRRDFYGPADESGNRALTSDAMQRILGRRRSPVDDMEERARVERLEREARTVQERQRAAEARARLVAGDQGAGAGSDREVDAAVRIARQREADQARFQLSEAAKERVRNAQASIDTLRAETQVMGGSIAVQEKVRLETQLINEARREAQRLGLTVSDAEIAQYRRLAEEMGKVRQEQALTRLRSDTAFERQTMFLSDADKRIAGSMRSIYGDGWASQMNSAEAAQLRLNEALKQGADYVVDFSRGFTQDLRNGVGVMDALGNSFLRVGQRMLDSQIEQMIRSMFGTGGMGAAPFGFLSSLFGLGGGAGGMSPFGFYDRGGYTGPGGVHQPAGVVHRGEVVWSQRDVARFGGVAAVEAMRTGGLRGYADGGAVGYRAAANNNFLTPRAASAPPGQSIRMGDIVIQGNVTPDAMPMLQAELANQRRQIQALTKGAAKSMRANQSGAYENKTGVMLGAA